MDLTWNPAKAEANFRKRGIRFSDVDTVLFDPIALPMEDDDAEGENRFVTIGQDAAGSVLVVIYTYGGEQISLISARKATRKETQDYEKRI